MFTWRPDAMPTADVEFNVLVSQFGDGYSQATKDGLNNKVQTWPVSFTRDVSEITAISDFLDARGGAESFAWTNPLGWPGLYRSTKYTIQPLGAAHRLTTTFAEVFAP